SPRSLSSGSYPRSLHDALPIWLVARAAAPRDLSVPPPAGRKYRPHHLYVESCQVRHQHAPDVLLLGLTFDVEVEPDHQYGPPPIDRKSTRLNSSHVSTSYAVFC